MSLVKKRSAATRAPGPLTSHFCSGGLVPGAAGPAHRVVLADGVAEPGDPVPALPFGELRPGISRWTASKGVLVSVGIGREICGISPAETAE